MYQPLYIILRGSRYVSYLYLTEWVFIGRFEEDIEKEKVGRIANKRENCFQPITQHHVCV